MSDLTELVIWSASFSFVINFKTDTDNERIADPNSFSWVKISSKAFFSSETASTFDLIC
eukprot:gnl/Chilomastix_caulleri/5582.p1 GENE.gnl/Chilomastix_caulleri/5582~~gnl/Chilomastix_caulleri/5582.p1  ORF type:complete len:59 (-),score=4.25 gnl/Chilomastix_caulleri/5582:52-228(-)